jgi:CHAT domain-containing protein
MPREDSLHLVLIRPNAAPIVRDLYDVSSAKLADVVGAFVQNVTNPRRPKNLQASQQLYRWLIQPFEAEFFQPADIDTLLFCLGDGLRGVPLAALHDGDHFLIEKYAIARIPAFNLIAHDYQNIQQGGIVAMGASEFTEQSPLPAVPLEIKTVINQLRSLKPAKAEWQELALLNSDFTRNNLQAILANRSFDIVHIATHADFAPGEPSASYIQFDDGKLTLPQMAELPWAKADVNLLVLSACRTAFGDSGAELGFAGLALEAGVDSAIASQWYVSDAGTLALMGEFYQELSLNTTKAEALRQAQLKMLRGEIEFTEDQLFLDRGSVVPIPQDLREDIPSTTDLSHPYYWAAFSLISSPW